LNEILISFIVFLLKFQRNLIIFGSIMGIGIEDWGLGIGDWAQSPIPSPQAPSPSPHKLSRKKYNEINIY
jgi:hypothetical protein